MAFRSIKIAAPNGANTMTFSQEYVNLPASFPEFEYEHMNKSFQMRRTLTGPGRRVWKSVGNDMNHANFSIKLDLLTDTQVNTLLALYKASPNVILFSIDSGATRYFAIFNTGGLTILPYSKNESPVTGRPFQLSAELDLSILQATTTNFGV